MSRLLVVSWHAVDPVVRVARVLRGRQRQQRHQQRCHRRRQHGRPQVIRRALFTVRT